MQGNLFSFCTSTVLYARNSLELACGEIAALGIPAVDIWHVPNWCTHLDPGLHSVRAILQRHGLRLEAISAYGRSPQELPPLLELLAELGGHSLVMGSLGPDVSVAAFARRIEPLVQKATDLGVCLAVENHGQATIDSLASMLELATLLPQSGLGFALAPIHLWRRGEDVATAIRQLKGRLGLVYIWDWGPSADADWKDPSEQFLGTGRIAYSPIFRALAAIAYDRPLCLFAHGAEEWPPARTSAALARALRHAAAMGAEAQGAECGQAPPDF